MQRIDATEWWSRAVRANSAFLVKEQTRDTERFANTENSSAYKTMRHQYDNICKVLDVLYQLNPTQEAKNAIQAINNKTEEYLVRAKAHKTRLENEKLETESQN